MKYSAQLYDDFMAILPENFDEMELIFCVQTLITYSFWNKTLLKIDEKDFQKYSVRDMIERMASLKEQIIPDLSKGDARSEEYRSALQSRNSMLLSGIIYKNLYNKGEGMPDGPPKIIFKLTTLIQETLVKCVEAQTEFMVNEIQRIGKEFKDNKPEENELTKLQKIIDEKSKLLPIFFNTWGCIMLILYVL